MKIRRIKLWIRRRVKLPAMAREFLIAIAGAFVACYLSTPSNPAALLGPLCSVATLNVFKVCDANPLPGSGALGGIIEPRVTDLWFSIRGPLPSPKNILIIAVDEESHAKLGVSSLAPWPRQLTAQLLKRISQFNPQAIIVDFSYSDNLDPKIDRELADAMTLSPTYIAHIDKRVITTGPTGEPVNKLVPIEPAEIFSKSAKGVFVANLSADSGIIRRFYFGKSTFSSSTQPATLVSDSTNEQTPPVLIPAEAPPIPALAENLFGRDAHDKKLPLPYDYINYYGPAGTIPTASFYEILNGSDDFLQKAISGKYVLLGQKLMMSYAAQQTDTFITPIHGTMAGVEIHATVVGNFLDGSWLRGPSQLLRLYIIFYFSFFLIYSIFYFSSSGTAIILVVGALVGWTAISFVGFLYGYFIPGAIVVFGVLPVAYALSSLRSHLRTKALEKAIGLSR